MNTHNNNSTNISGGSVTGNQFAAGSHDFKGTINNITRAQTQKLENLTDKLIAAIQKENNFDNKQEIVDAVEQVRSEAKKKTINKISLQGILTGINMFLSTEKVATTTFDLYTHWHEYVSSLS